MMGKSIVKPELLPINIGGLIGSLNGKSPIDGQKSILKPELLRINFQRKKCVKAGMFADYFLRKKVY